MNPRFQGEAFEKNLELVRRIEDLAEAKGCTPAQLALAWVLAQGDDVVGDLADAVRLDIAEELQGQVQVLLSHRPYPSGRAAGEIVQIPVGASHPARKNKWQPRELLPRLPEIELVCGDSLDSDVFDALDTLVEHSLIRSLPQRGQPRFRMLETIRHFAHRQLVARGEAALLAERHARLGAVRGAGLDAIEALGPFDLVVNATSAGHDGGAPGIRASWLQADGLCYDMNYSNAAEPLRAACERTGLDYRDGLGMLVGQAALSFELWTGQRPDPLPVIEGLRDAARE